MDKYTNIEKNGVFTNVRIDIQKCPSRIADII